MAGNQQFFRDLAPSVQALPMLAAGRGADFSADVQVHGASVCSASIHDFRLALTEARSQREKAQRDWESLLDDEDSFRIPIGVRIEDSLDTGGLETASLHTAIPQHNKGFQMLQRMGWKGQGLGREESGEFFPAVGLLASRLQRKAVFGLQLDFAHLKPSACQGCKSAKVHT